MGVHDNAGWVFMMGQNMHLTAELNIKMTHVRSNPYNIAILVLVEVIRYESSKMHYLSPGLGCSITRTDQTVI